MADKEQIFEKIDDASLAMIVVVATDASMLKMLEMALKVEYPCEVFPFISGRSALKAVNHIKPDLVIIHSQLLEMNALTLVDHLHSLEGLESVPTILTHTPLVSESESQGPYLIALGMPFALEDLYASVNICLGRT